MVMKNPRPCKVESGFDALAPYGVVIQKLQDGGLLGLWAETAVLLPPGEG